ncbi:unnamed protein product [Phaedon cochleariae]|uniref:WD repeat-containing protein 60 n=1 Tax=Phaedon cochleariae TaxID=80249 RepID=A0A9P0DNN7_PHACE|nr:unnamed protein product [Phaedon cochleariae]
MSTKKDVGKATSTRKSSTSTSKINAKTREESMDRKKKEKKEIPIKATSLKPKKSENKEVEPDTKPKVPKSSSKPSVDSKVTISKKKLSSDGPKTPSGSKISKTQFFPTKTMYSNALKDKDEKGAGDNIKRPVKEELSSKKSSQNTAPPKKTTTKTDKLEATRNVNKAKSLINVSNRTLADKTTPRSPIADLKKNGPVKILRSKQPPSLESNKSAYTSPDTSTISERPRTATLRKGSIVNANIVGPDAPRTLAKVKSPTPRSSEEEFNYEDDFDSYESDFEQYSSSSSNADNLSGEGTSSGSSSDQEVAPRELQSARRKVLSAGSEEERKLDSGHFDMPDFKHKQILDNIKESVEKENSNLMLSNNPASLSDEGFEEQKSLQMINFLDAQKKHEHRKSVEIKRKRGEEILSMIRLDTYSFTLFDLPPVPYDVFIKNYGSTNSVQIAVQTGEDDIDEDTQTDFVDMSTKWTQAPVAFSNIEEDDPQFWQTYKQDYLGVGNENCEESKWETTRFNEFSLNNFFSSAGNLVLRILEESRIGNINKLEKNSRAIPFSAGYISLNTSEDIFKDSTVKFVTFSCDIRGRIMTVHSRKSDGDSVLAVWRICDPEKPEAVYLSHGVSCCSFGPEKLGLVFAGLTSGMLSVWNLRRKKEEFGNSADFCTDIGCGHDSKIIGLYPIGDISDSSFNELSQTNEVRESDYLILIHN